MRRHDRSEPGLRTTSRLLEQHLAAQPAPSACLYYTIICSAV